jgi:Flp pilus assembly protein CpaB
MKSRGLVVAIAVVLAVLAAVGVIVYTSNVKSGVSDEQVAVVVSTVDIAPNTQLDALLQQNVFTQISVPQEAAVPNVVTSTEELVGRTTSAPIYQNEQIPLARLGEGGDILGIEDGHIAIGLDVSGPAAVNGYIQQGRYIGIYATFSAGTPVLKADLKKLFSAAQIQKLYDQIQGTGTTTSLATSSVLLLPTDTTVTLFPAVKVLAIQNPSVDETSGRSSGGSSTMVLDLAPEDATDLVHALSISKLYMGLLPPDNDKGYVTPGSMGVTLAKVTGVAK